MNVFLIYDEMCERKRTRAKSSVLKPLPSLVLLLSVAKKSSC